MKILITGCARSGTTLMQRMMYAFEDTEVIDREIRFDDFVKVESKKKFLVGKRQAHTILSYHLPADVLHTQELLIKEHDIKIINMIRNGRDVVRPAYAKTNLVNEKRWAMCMNQSIRFAHLINLEIDYEDLVYLTPVVQCKLEEELGLVSEYRFTDYPVFVPEKAFDFPRMKHYNARELFLPRGRSLYPGSNPLFCQAIKAYERHQIVFS